MFAFDILHRDSSGGRLGRLTTPHGMLETPNFIFCATKAAIKGASVTAMRRAGADIILGNTYHLMLQPGAALVEQMGGLHQFTRWNGPMLTDSGGYQVFSMGGATPGEATLRKAELQGKAQLNRPNTVLKISEEGVAFQSYLDGTKHFLTPESSMQIQRQLGADLIMAFDECTALHHDYDYTARSLQMTHRWAQRSLNAFEKLNTDGKQGLYGIIQGGVHRNLREEAVQFINAQEGFFGTAFGGCYGETSADLYAMLDWVAPYLKREGQTQRPVHLLGIGNIPDIFHGVRCGIDTFDCVQPTRLARHGWALMQGAPNCRLNLRNAQFREDKTPLDPAGHHEETAHYTRAYLHHLLRAGEQLAVQLLVEHNVSVMTRLLREIRTALREGALDNLQASWLTQTEAAA